MTELEQKLQVLLEGEQGSVHFLEEAGIIALKDRESSAHQFRQVIDNQFMDGLHNWAGLHSVRWKKIMGVLLEAEVTRLGFINDRELNEFCAYIKGGLIPLWTEETHKPDNKEYFYDFLNDHFVRLLDDGDGTKRVMIGFSITGIDSYNRTLIGDEIILENLIPENFLNRLGSLLKLEKEEKTLIGV